MAIRVTSKSVGTTVDRPAVSTTLSYCCGRGVAAGHRRLPVPSMDRQAAIQRQQRGQPRTDGARCVIRNDH